MGALSSYLAIAIDGFMARNLTLTVLATGVVILVLPIFLPPDPEYPAVMLFVPYALLFIAALLPRFHEYATPLLITSLAVAVIGSFLYLDALRFNLLLSYQSSAETTAFIPWFQLALCFPVILRLFRRNKRPDLEMSCTRQP